MSRLRGSSIDTLWQSNIHWIDAFTSTSHNMNSAIKLYLWCLYRQNEKPTLSICCSDSERYSLVRQRLTLACLFRFISACYDNQPAACCRSVDPISGDLLRTTGSVRAKNKYRKYSITILYFKLIGLTANENKLLMIRYSYVELEIWTCLIYVWWKRT